MTRYFCCDQRRREGLIDHATLNGIDFLEIDDELSLTDAERLLRQRILKVYFVKPISALALSAENIRISGGERIRGVGVENVIIDDINDRLLIVTVDRVGDFSAYQLKLVIGSDNELPPEGIDPHSATVVFSFKLACPSDFDCLEEKECSPQSEQAPVIDYLAKDYASFRRLILDRLTYLMPDWQTKTPADMATTLVEIFAYLGDHLSYRQDAVATEAYLDTARLRSSVRRHARLVDYRMHDGRNARVWVQIGVSAPLTLAAQSQCMTQLQDLPVTFPRDSVEYEKAINHKPMVFETLYEAQLFPEHNELQFYTWGDRECCLPVGAISTSLRGHYPNLVAGDVLIFEELLSPLSGLPADANSDRRVAVLLTRVELTEDPLGGRFETSPTDDSVAITKITWSRNDALSQPFCLSAQTEIAYQEVISIARGNIVLADHGLQFEDSLDPVPAPSIQYPPEGKNSRCEPSEIETVLPRFRPRLRVKNLTQAAKSYLFSDASSALEPPLSEVQPAVSLLDREGFRWQPLADLINANRFARNFVVEQETDGSAYVRFGDNSSGRFPESGELFSVQARVGSGSMGNIGGEALAHLVSGDSGIDFVRNPLPAQGGCDPESMSEAVQNAPYAFRTQERAVTVEDWAEVARRHPDVQNAVATFRWTGSWYTVFMTVDRFDGKAVDTAFEQTLRRFLEKYRLAGYDLEVDAAHYVSLEIKLFICVKPHYFRDVIKREVLKVLSNRSLVDGSLGQFHPDYFTFGQTVHLSPVLARVQQIEGVSSVEPKVFRRQGALGRDDLDLGRIELGRLEVARLDNSANFPEHGSLQLTMGGGA